MCVAKKSSKIASKIKSQIRRLIVIAIALASATPGYASLDGCESAGLNKSEPPTQLRPMLLKDRKILETAEDQFNKAYDVSLENMKSAAPGTQIEISNEGLRALARIGKYGNESHAKRFERLGSLKYGNSGVPAFASQTQKALANASNLIQQRILFEKETLMSDQDLESFNSWVTQGNTQGYLFEVPLKNLTWRGANYLFTLLTHPMAKFQVIDRFSKLFDESDNRKLNLAREWLTLANARLGKITRPVTQVEASTLINDEAAYDYLSTSKVVDDNTLVLEYVSLTEQKYTDEAMHLQAIAAINVRADNQTLILFEDHPTDNQPVNGPDRRNGGNVFTQDRLLSLNLPLWTRRLVQSVEYSFDPKDKIFEYETNQPVFNTEDSPHYEGHWLAGEGAHEVEIKIKTKFGRVVFVTAKLIAEFPPPPPKEKSNNEGQQEEDGQYPDLGTP